VQTAAGQIQCNTRLVFVHINIDAHIRCLPFYIRAYTGGFTKLIYYRVLDLECAELGVRDG